MSSPSHQFIICSKTFVLVVIVWSLFGFPASFRTIPVSASLPESPVAGGVSQPELSAAYRALPLNFELNQGQTHQRVKFLARSNGYVLFLTGTEAVMALDNPATHRKGKENRDARDRDKEFANEFAYRERKGRPPRSIVRMKLAGANPAPQVEGLDELTTRSNYFAGSDPSSWRTDIPSYARVRYAQVYPGIDMV